MSVLRPPKNRTGYLACLFHRAGGERPAISMNVQQPSEGRDAQNPRTTTDLSYAVARRRFSNCVPCLGKDFQELERALLQPGHTSTWVGTHPKPS
jgi:hypothetical protein